MPDDSDFPDAILDVTRMVVAAARETAASLKAEAERAVHAQDVWESLDLYLRRGWSMHVLATLEKEAAVIGSMLEQQDRPEATLDGIRDIAAQGAEGTLRRFPALIDAACSDAGFPPDRTSRHPKYSFERGFFQLRIEERRKLALLSDYEGHLAELPADVGAVTETLQREHTRVFGREFHGQIFIQRLRHQYLQVVKKAGVGDGDAVPIRRITRRFGKNVRRFRTDEFLIDLSRLLTEGPLEIDDRRLDLQQTKDTSQGMLLHGAASRGYVGYVIFTRV